ncbi:MAG: HPr family phosphocarrier protein [Gemmatimonadetes bacterium]|nr:HPr family phosphocarrier protein [Gemmatimonadota bacterium]
MTAPTLEARRAVRISNRYGLHARPAAAFVKVAARFRCQIMVAKDELEVNGKSIMGMMMLAAEQGTEIIIRATGDESADAVAALVALVERGFDEE